MQISCLFCKLVCIFLHFNFSYKNGFAFFACVLGFFCTLIFGGPFFSCIFCIFSFFCIFLQNIFFTVFQKEAAAGPHKAKAKKQDTKQRTKMSCFFEPAAPTTAPETGGGFYPLHTLSWAKGAVKGRNPHFERMRSWKKLGRSLHLGVLLRGCEGLAVLRCSSRNAGLEQRLGKLTGRPNTKEVPATPENPSNTPQQSTSDAKEEVPALPKEGEQQFGSPSPSTIGYLVASSLFELCGTKACKCR